MLLRCAIVIAGPILFFEDILYAPGPSMQYKDSLQMLFVCVCMSLPGWSVHFWSKVLFRLAIVIAGPKLFCDGTLYAPGPLKQININRCEYFTVFIFIFLFTWKVITSLVKSVASCSNGHHWAAQKCVQIIISWSCLYYIKYAFAR